MNKLLLVPVMLLAACVAKPEVVTEETGTETGQSIGGVGGGADNEVFDTPRLVASILQDPASCDDNSAYVYGVYSYTDGSSTENVVCQFIFADGTTSDGCFAVHSFPEPENVILVVRDTVTLAETRFEEVVVGPESFTASLDVTSAGLTINWQAHTLYGTAQDVTGVRISIDPAANVVETDPDLFSQYSGTATVTAPGTYTVKLQTSITFGEEGGCGAEIEKTVEVVGDGGGGGGGEPPCDDPTHAH